MRNILRLSVAMKKLGGKTAEEKYAEASECWKTDPERVADAAEKYFMPPKEILHTLQPCKKANPISLVLSGIAAGDIAGEPYEGGFAGDHYPDKDYREIPFFIECSCFTDDTVMSFACERAACANRKYHNDGKSAVLMYEANLRKFARRFPNAGYGANFYSWALLGENNNEYRSYGNGGAMRSGVIGAVFADDDIRTVIRQAVYSALPSHSHPEGIKGAVVTAVSVYLALHEVPKEYIDQYMSFFYTEPFRDIWSPMPYMSIGELIGHGWQCASVTTQITMPEVIINLRDSDSYESCIRNVFRYPCDSDTIGAISGGIAAALYGNVSAEGIDIRKELRERLQELEDFGGRL